MTPDPITPPPGPSQRDLATARRLRRQFRHDIPRAALMPEHGVFQEDVQFRLRAEQAGVLRAFVTDAVRAAKRRPRP